MIELYCRFPLTSAGKTPFFDLTRYNDFPEFENYIRGVARMNPDLTSLRLIGFSREHRPLLGLKIGHRTNYTKPAVWLDGGNHAREWPAFHVAVYFIEELVHNYGVDEKVTSYLDLLDIYIFPVLNPDGFIFSRTSKKSVIRQWRKNRAPTNCSGWTALVKNICCEGVDLNRNYDLGFSQLNYPFNNPCSDEFQGPFPFSEPESRAVRDFVLSREIYGRLHALVSMHTHGQLWILPYNHHKRTYPEDFRELERLAAKAADKVYSYRETKYRIGTAADMLGRSSLFFFSVRKMSPATILQERQLVVQPIG
ncbi:zinc carboxypeptidase [Necator americanus]|uniref:Zinc carboxypeptidase n=1 Tax=Necator americanus TaxID=51031 RepID=W2T013_NECAM|nr:zinc carboxypeptidase [Necator americanus]ETN75335.1 zinc carboxypeptidase [Necator americanus]